MKLPLSIPSVLEALEMQEDLRIYFAANPQAVLMPFAEDHHRHFLAVVVFVIDQAINLEVLSVICSRIIQVLRSKNHLDHLGGVEIMPCAIKESKTERILRLSIPADDLRLAEKLSPDDLKEPKLFKRSTCHLYLRNIPN